jgi:hypothetical protein
VAALSARPCPRGRAYAGSQLQLQIYVNRRSEELSQRVLDALLMTSLNAHLRWVSPLESEDFAEYRDGAFLDALGRGHLKCQLSSFWPADGPCWDALAVAELGKDPGRSGVLLVEAKSYPDEVYGPGCGARSRRSLRMIDAALDETKCWLGVREDVDWMGRLYQSGNRLAHLYFFLQVGIPAWLVNVYFLNDPCPRYRTTREEWNAALPQVKAELGVASFIPHSADVFLEAKDHHELVGPTDVEAGGA